MAMVGPRMGGRSGWRPTDRRARADWCAHAAALATLTHVRPTLPAQRIRVALGCVSPSLFLRFFEDMVLAMVVFRK